MGLYGAFLGAVISDQGAQFAKHFLITCIETYLPMEDNWYTNYKENYQIFCQRRKWDNPVYITVHTERPSDSRVYTQATFLNTSFLKDNKSVLQRVRAYHDSVLAELDGKLRETINSYSSDYMCLLVGIATEHKKKVAEQECAKLALDLLVTKESVL